MFALINAASGRILDWHPQAMTPGEGQVVIQLPDDLSLLSSFTQRWVAATPRAIAGISQADGIATAVTVAEHGLHTGWPIEIAGVDQPEYNDQFLPTVVGASGFTFEVDPAAPTPATGATMTVTPAEGFRTVSQAEIDQTVEWIKDAQAVAAFSEDDRDISPLVAKKAIISLAAITHFYLQRIEVMAGLPAVTVPGLLPFLQQLREELRQRL